MHLLSHSLTEPLRLHLHLQRLLLYRTFINAKVKWVQDPYLDTFILTQKNLKPLLILKTLITSQPSKTLPLSTLSSQKHHHHLNLPSTTTITKFIQNYPSIFQIFQPTKPLSLPHVKLTPQVLKLHNEEDVVLNSWIYKRDAAERVVKLLMLTKAKRVPLMVIDRLKFDMGLPYNFVMSLVNDFPEYFQICSMGCRDENGCEVLGLELISWRDEFAVSVLERKAMEENFGCRRGVPIKYSMNFPRGFDLGKRVKNWVVEWQKLPYISPYEDAFHLSPNSDQAEKWTVGVLHELLHLCVSKKTEREILFCLGDYLGFGTRFKNALRHHPGIFYISNKIRTQTVILREAYKNKKEFLVEKHPLVGIWYRYIHLMNKMVKQKQPIRAQADGRRKQISASSAKGERRNENGWREGKQEEESNVSSDSELETIDDEGMDVKV
ncbi:hypothetical protein LguiA_027033 [Lonicera macranthoides]